MERHKNKEAKPYQCQVCFQRFALRSYLSNHMVRHTEGKPHKCPQCEACFKTKGEMKTHAERHTNIRPFVCSICTSAFKSKSELKGHMAVHSDEKSHKCNLCPSAFKYKESLRRHLVLHANEDCDVSKGDRKNGEGSNLDEVVVKLEELLEGDANEDDLKANPFICLLCRSIFRTEDDLRRTYVCSC